MSTNICGEHRRWAFCALIIINGVIGIAIAITIKGIGIAAIRESDIVERQIRIGLIQ